MTLDRALAAELSASQLSFNSLSADGCLDVKDKIDSDTNTYLERKVLTSPLFDASWYGQCAGLELSSTSDLLAHYNANFATSDPHPLFNAVYYRELISLPAKVNPLNHFVENCWKEEYRLVSPTPYFDSEFYLRNAGAFMADGQHPLVHYLTVGWREYLQPSAFFSPRWYLQRYKDIAATGIEPLGHFVNRGVEEYRQPHALIDLNYYLVGAPDLPRSPAFAYRHYITHGDREGRSAHPLFDPNFYRAGGSNFTDVGAFAHYVEYGVRDRRSPCPAFDPKHYATMYPYEAEDPLMSFLLADVRDRPHFHPLIDGNYQSLTSQRAADGTNPLFDYMQFRSTFAMGDLWRGATTIPLPRKGHVPDTISRKDKLKAEPRVSVIIPCYNSDPRYLEPCVRSVMAQSYSNWELILINDGSPKEGFSEYLEEIAALDARIVVHTLRKNYNISFATTFGAREADGEFLAFIDHDDVITPNALATLMDAIAVEDADVAYSDQAFLSGGGVEEPNFKPAWSPALFCGVMYVGHLLIVRKSVARAAGYFKSQFDGCQDFEFMLRVSEQTKRIVHVPQVLYHWRRAETSIAANSNIKGKIEPKQARAVKEHLSRIGFPAYPVPDERVAHRLRLRPLPRQGRVTVDIIIQGPLPVGDNMLESWLTAPGVDIGSVTVADFATTPAECVPQGRAPWVLFLDPAMRPTHKEWFDTRLMYALQDDIAFVASHIYSARGTVVSAGLVATVEGLLDAYQGFEEGNDGTWGTLFCDREVAALHARCTLVSRNMLNRFGLDPIFLSCDGALGEASYRATLSGWRNISIATPLVTGPAASSASVLQATADRQFFVDRNHTTLAMGDRYYNANFALGRADFSAA